MWKYEWNNPGCPEDGFSLVSPADRDVGHIDDEVDAREVVALLNEALLARSAK